MRCVGDLSKLGVPTHTISLVLLRMLLQHNTVEWLNQIQNKVRSHLCVYQTISSAHAVFFHSVFFTPSVTGFLINVLTSMEPYVTISNRALSLEYISNHIFIARIDILVIAAKCNINSITTLTEYNVKDKYLLTCTTSLPFCQRKYRQLRHGLRTSVLWNYKRGRFQTIDFNTLVFRLVCCIYYTSHHA